MLADATNFASKWQGNNEGGRREAERDLEHLCWKPIARGPAELAQTLSNYSKTELEREWVGNRKIASKSQQWGILNQADHAVEASGLK